MFSCHALRFLDCPYFFTCIFCVKIIEQIAEWGKIIIAFGAVHAVIDCDIAHITLYEKDFRIVTDFQIVTPQARHIFDYDCSHISGFNLCYHAVKIRAVKGYAGNTVINEKCWISKAVVSSVFG
ncbi:hypothetical protein EDD78_10364 [Harryflintia acetispora]|uniref:Uncharacterized protein n=1 Tax=Harryflintia acetispora TaxID=1849041 RepID=A0A9X8UJS3_9FIRM|nr:hypothetical protein EDD78_10364 [Harryflintia acetispora]